jgi:hypothetical protein
MTPRHSSASIENFADCLAAHSISYTNPQIDRPM